MSENTSENPARTAVTAGSARLSPVWQFVLLIVPIVMNGFFLVYAITGWLIDGRNLVNWSIEAPSVALYVGAGMTLFCVLVLLLLKWRGLSWRHPVGLSSIAHAVLALLLASMIAGAVRG